MKLCTLKAPLAKAGAFSVQSFSHISSSNDIERFTNIPIRCEVDQDDCRNHHTQQNRLNVVNGKHNAENLSITCSACIYCKSASRLFTVSVPSQYHLKSLNTSQEK